MTMKMRRMAALCTFTLLGCAASAQTRIGFIGTFSGPGAALGQDQFDGFMLAIEQKGGKLGGSPVQVIKEDDQLKPELGVQLVQKLIEKEKVDLVTGITFSNVMMAAAKPLAAANQIFVGSNAGPAALAGSQCNANFFFTSWQNDALAEVLGKYANEKGYRKVVMLAPNYQAGKDSITGFKRYFKGAVAGEIYTQLNQPDYAAELAQVQALAPDAVYVFFPGGMGINFIKQMKQAGLLSKIPLLTVGAADGTTLPALKEGAEGVLMGAHWGPDFKNPANKAFVSAFEAKYQRIPSQYAAQSFDAAMLIDSAMGKTGGSAANKAALRDALRQAQFESVRGPFSFSKNGFPVQDMYVFQVAKDDKGRTSLKTIGSPLKGHVDAYVPECPLR